MSENEQYYRLLLQRFVEKAATEDETAILLHELGESDIDDVLERYMEADAFAYLQQHPLEPIVSDKKVKFRTYLPFAIAAALLLFIVSAYLFYSHNTAQPKSFAERMQNNVLPGRDKAVLISGDGSFISLNDQQKDTLFHTDQSIVKIKEGIMVFANQNVQTSSSEVKDYVVKTPRGGQYQVVLPDGTKVKLNAASELRFPIGFSGKERKVFLKGEAYFDVVHDNTKPFKVQTETQLIEDIGTTFNVSSYDDDGFGATTLLQGSVRLSNLNNAQVTVLKPGQQAKLTNNVLKVKDVDVDEVLGWKENKFVFGGNSIGSVMKQVARWYDVDVVFEGEETKESFVGIISRQNNISEILQMLEATHMVEFSVKGRTVIVSSASNR